MPIIRWGHLSDHAGHDVRIVRIDPEHVVLECIECGCSIVEEQRIDGVTDEQ